MKTLKLICVTALVVIFCNKSNSQIYIGSKSYKSTPTFKFSQNSSGLNSFSYAQVTIGKRSSTQGLIMISMPSFQGKLVKGIMIYLEDGTAISCVDRGLFDSVDNQTIGIWYLSEGEINKMKYSNISSIRYNVLSMGISVESYTIRNSFKSAYSNSPFPKSSDIPYYVKELF